MSGTAGIPAVHGREEVNPKKLTTRQADPGQAKARRVIAAKYLEVAADAVQKVGNGHPGTAMILDRGPRGSSSAELSSRSSWTATCSRERVNWSVCEFGARL